MTKRSQLPREDIIVIDKDTYVLTNPETKKGSLYIESNSFQCKVGTGNRYNTIPYAPWSMSTSSIEILDVEDVVSSLDGLDTSKTYIWIGADTFPVGYILTRTSNAWVASIPQLNSFAWASLQYKLYFWDGEVWTNVSVNPHNNLVGLQGGKPDERYHLSEHDYLEFIHSVWRQPVDELISAAFPVGVVPGYRVAVQSDVPDDTYDSFEYRGFICEYDGETWIPEEKSVGMTTYNKDDNFVYSWTGEVWFTVSVGEDETAMRAITPTEANCLVAWNDQVGAFIKCAGRNAYVKDGLTIRTPAGTGHGEYLLKLHASRSTKVIGGILDLQPYVICAYDEHPNIGFVANVYKSQVKEQFGGGLVISGHGMFDRIETWIPPYVSLVVKARDSDRVIDAFRVFSDGSTVFYYPVTIPEINLPAGKTFNINGQPHNHDAFYLKKTGDTLVGDLNAGGYKITNLPRPTLGTDAVNLDFVSGLLVGLTWGDPVLSIIDEPVAVNGRYLVAGSVAEGSTFDGHENSVATYNGSWSYEVPDIGLTVLVEDEGCSYTFNGATWSKMSGVVSHNSLQSLTNTDDHTQYVHMALARAISAKHTFSNGFNVGTTDLVANLNAQFIEGKALSDLALALHTHNLEALGNVRIVGLSDGDVVKYDAVLGKFVNSPNDAMITIDPNHQFVSDTARDLYFTANPDELENGTFCVVGTQFFQWDGEQWNERTPIIRGPAGEDGKDGIDGADGLPGPTGETGAMGPEGPEGPPGAPGAIANLKGAVANAAALPGVASNGDAYITQDTKDCWIYVTGQGWTNAGKVVGPQGIQGVQGPVGPTGSQGPTGPTGPIGLTGPQGPLGPRGPAGITAYWWDSVEDILPEPPVNVDIGDRFIIADVPTNDEDNLWKDHATEIAEFVEPGAWAFDVPPLGCMLYCVDERVHKKFNGSTWESWASGVSSWEEIANKPDLPTLEDGKIPGTYLPSYVDDVIECGTDSARPDVGEVGKIYVVTETNKTYRWSGTQYIEIGGGGVQLGETSLTAYRGDRGKTAYDHSQATHAPTDAQKNSDITKSEIEAKLTGTISSHTHSAGTPTSHATSHVTGGGDVIANAVASGNAGLMSGADKAKLDGIAAGATANTGDTVGPVGATDNAIARFDAATGKLLQNSLATIDDNGSINIPAGQTYKVGGSALVTADEKVKVSSNDTTAGYLNGKLVAGAGLVLTEGTDGGNETLTVGLASTFNAVSATYTLPTPVAGLTVDIVGVGNVWKATATAGVVIRMGPDVSAAAGNLTASSGYDCATLTAINTTTWVVKSCIGVLTIDAV